MHAIYVESGMLSGAEKRAFKLHYCLNSYGNSCKILTNRKLFELLKNSEYKQVTKDCIVIGENWLSRIKEFQRLKTIRKYSGFNKIVEFLYHKKIINILKNNNVDLIHVFLFLDFKVAKKISKETSAKLIYEITSPDYARRIAENKKQYLNSFHYFNAVSDSVYYNALNSIPVERLGKAPVPLFVPDENHYDQASLFEMKENIIIFAHRLIPRKNGLMFAKAIKLFLKRNSDWTVKIFGKGPEADKINALLSEEIRLGQVFVGYSTQIITELKKSKIFVSIIEPDNYPSQSVLEAMYTGNALLLSDRGFTREKFIDGNGVTCEIIEDEIAYQLTELTQDKFKLEQMGKNSLSLLKERYDKSIYLDYICGMYDSLTGNKS